MSIILLIAIINVSNALVTALNIAPLNPATESALALALIKQ